MLKFRITFVDTEEGGAELEAAMQQLENNFEIINKSMVYQGRGESKYSNIYLDLEVKQKRKWTIGESKD